MKAKLNIQVIDMASAASQRLEQHSMSPQKLDLGKIRWMQPHPQSSQFSKETVRLEKRSVTS